MGISYVFTSIRVVPVGARYCDVVVVVVAVVVTVVVIVVGFCSLIRRFCWCLYS